MKMPMWATGPIQKNDCCRFTFVELVAATAVLFILFGIAATSLSLNPPGLSLEKELLKVSRFAAECRQLSIIQKKKVSAVYHRESHCFSYEQKNLAISGSIQIKDGTEPLADRAVVFSFFPDGTAGGKKLVFEYEEERIEFLLSPLTGLVHMKEQQ